mmetsp:Transcript_70433/g.229001  ORF Transcript_70433/g.229001 Transcript_70433/m.229001 type:complete len:200 (+) Transcript_70433:26-625(+)
MPKSNQACPSLKKPSARLSAFRTPAFDTHDRLQGKHSGKLGRPWNLEIGHWEPLGQTLPDWRPLAKSYCRPLASLAQVASTNMLQARPMASPWCDLRGPAWSQGAKQLQRFPAPELNERRWSEARPTRHCSMHVHHVLVLPFASRGWFNKPCARACPSSSARAWPSVPRAAAPPGAPPRAPRVGPRAAAPPKPTACHRP